MGENRDKQSRTGVNDQVVNSEGRQPFASDTDNEGLLHEGVGLPVVTWLR